LINFVDTKDFTSEQAIAKINQANFVSCPAATCLLCCRGWVCKPYTLEAGWLAAWRLRVRCL
jgi:hypothetical protein